MGLNFSRITDKQIQEIYNQTGMRRQEIKTLHKDFRKQHPKGKLKLKQFKEAFQKSVPNGDVSKFAEHVFKSFDSNGDGYLDFKEYVIGMSITQEKKIGKKLKWAFNIYDIDKNGLISRDEMTEIITAVYKMSDQTNDIEISAKKKVDQIFETLDIDIDGSIGLDEFLEGAMIDESIATFLST